MAEAKDPLAGRTFRWTFNDGPTAGKTYEHVFSTDGTVVFREANAAPQGAPTGEQQPGAKYASFQIAPNTHLVSYLSNTGTAQCRDESRHKQLHGFASNDKEWHPVKGTVDVVK